MALLERLRAAVGPAADPRLLARALGPGRMRGIASDLYLAAHGQPRRAGGILRRGLREARSLHSRERRLVSDALYGGFRMGAILEAATGLDGFEACWAGHLLLRGLEAEQVEGLDLERWRAMEEGDLELSPETLAGTPEIWRVLQQDLGEQRAIEFLLASLDRAPVNIRVNTRKTTVSRLARALRDEGIDLAPCAHAPHGLEIRGRANLQGHRLYAQGHFEIQDEGSQLLAELVPGGHLLIDFCAGAGGKTLALAHKFDRLIACDVRARPLDELSRRASRAGVRVQIERLGRDGMPSAGRVPASSADVVLVDAPCSGTGTWRRHPELRERLNSLPEIRATQAAILDRASSLVAPGGVLVYGTCSVLPAENQAQLEAMVQRNPQWSVESLTPGHGRTDTHLSLSPDMHGTDGFFGAILRRS